MDDDDDARKRREQKGVEAIFSSPDESEDTQASTFVPGRRKDGTPGSVKMLISVLGIFVLFSIYWMLSSYEQDVYFRSYVSDTFSHYFSPVTLLAIGSTGLCLSIAWATAIHFQDQRKRSNPV